MDAIRFNRTLRGLYASFLLLACIAPVSAQQGESLTYDPATGKYIMYYYTTGYSIHEQRKLHRVVFELPNKIDPTIKSKFKTTDKGPLRYEYKVTNGRESKQGLVGMRLRPTHAYETGQSIPKEWYGSVNMFPDTTIVGWSYRSSQFGDGLKPGGSQSGFGYESRDLPGIGIIESSGEVVPSPTGEDKIPDMGPDPDTEVGKQYRELFYNNQYAPRYVAVPKIPVPTPFDAAMVLGGIQKHIKDDLIGMKLIDPVLASQLDRLLQAAIDAAKINNTAAVRSNIKEARKLLKKEHEDVDSEDDQDFDKDDANETKKSALIDRLVARVLDFDLKYIEKRLKVE